MSRKISVAIVAALLCTTLFAIPAMTQGVKNFVVLPFDYMGPEKFQHYGKSIRSVLKSKLNTPGVFEPADSSRAQTLEGITLDSPADAVRMLNASDVDYVVSGLVSMAGESATLEINALGKGGNTLSRSAEMPHDQLSLELNKLAASMTDELFNIGKPKDAPKMGERTANPTFIAAQTTEEGPQVSEINPEFRYEGGSQNSGRMQSQGLRFPSRGMTICDGDGDGTNEIFILSDYKLMAFRFEQGKLLQLAEMRFPNRNKPLNICSIDANKDGKHEIVVSTFYEGPQSFVYEFTGSGFTTKVERVNQFLNVLRMPPNYAPTLVAQRMGNTGSFRSNGAKEAYISKGDVVTGRGIRLPQFGNIYNVAFLPEENSYKIVLVDNYNRLRVFTSELAPDAQSQETYNSSAVPISLGTSAVPGLDTTRDAVDEQYYYIPITMKVSNLFSGGKKYEILLNKDVSVASQLFAKFRSFTQGEIHSLYWDGTGLNLAWKTRRVKGTVVAYDIADPDNDGKPNLVVMVNTYPGAIAVANIKTVIMVYDLNL